MSLAKQRLELSPAHWRRSRIKHHLLRIIGGGTPSKEREEFWTDGTIPWVSPKDMKRRWIDDAEDYITEEAVARSATSIIRPGAVLLVVRSGILKHSLPVAINTVPVALNQDMKALTFRPSLIPAFFAYWIEGQARNLLLEWGQIGATVDNLNVDSMLNAPIAVPDARTQAATVEFLDREISAIDNIIDQVGGQAAARNAANGTFLGLLLEKRSAILSASVTGKLSVEALKTLSRTSRHGREAMSA